MWKKESALSDDNNVKVKEPAINYLYLKLSCYKVNVLKNI